MDPLAEVLAVAQVRGAVLARVSASAPWGIRVAPASGAALHAITAGVCWLRMDGEPPLQLMPGDVVLLPQGTPHVIAGAARGPAAPLDRLAKRRLLRPDGALDLTGGAAATTRFLCAGYEYDHAVSQPLMSILPQLVHVPAAEPDSPAAATLRLLAAELGGDRPGAATVTDRLVDVLLVHALRAWLRGAGDEPSWLAGLSDPVTAAALRLLHDRPADPWTADELAAAVGVSRATLVRRFGHVVGRPPMSYLTTWRMDLAARALRDTDSPVETIARDVGYTSQFAFSRAFTRTRGIPPARYRRN